MKEPKRFNIVSSATYVFIGLLNAAFATIAYMFFGEKTGTCRKNCNLTVPEELVLENLCPDGQCTSTFVVIAISTLIVDVFFTFPLIMAPVYELLELSLFVVPQGEVVGSDYDSTIQAEEELKRYGDRKLPASFPIHSSSRKIS